jgi:hypothetical protein
VRYRFLIADKEGLLDAVRFHGTGFVEGFTHD